MKVFTREAIPALAQETGESLRVTAMMPLRNPGEDWKKDQVRLKNLVGEIDRQLEAGGVDARQKKAILRPAMDLLQQNETWPARGSLAMFLSPEGGQVYRVPLALDELVQVGTSYQLKPVMPLLEADGEFYVAVVSGNAFRLLLCTRDSVHRMELPEAPGSVDEATQEITPGQPHGRPMHTFRYNRAGGKLPMSQPYQQPQGFGQEERKWIEYRQYFQQIDDALHDLLAGEHAPLVFVGDQQHLPLFADVCRYPGLLSEGVYGNYEHESDDELRDRAWKLVEPCFHEDRYRTANRYHNLTGTGRTATALDQVLEAAVYGRVDALFYDLDDERFGTLVQDDGGVRVAPEGDQPLVNQAVVQTLLKGGKVFGVKREELPDNSEGNVVNAVLRW